MYKFFEIGIIACFAFGIPLATQAKHHGPDTANGQCQLAPPQERKTEPTPESDGTSEIVVNGYKLNKARNITIATCSGRIAATLSEFHIRTDPGNKWSRDLLVMAKDKAGTPIGFVHFPGPADECEYEVRMEFAGRSRRDDLSTTRSFDICHYAALIVHVDQLYAASRGSQAMASSK